MLNMSANRAFSLALALVLQPCIGPCDEWYAIDLQSKADITRSPLQSNLFNMKWSVASFKPRDLVTGEKLPFEKNDKRLVFKGKGKDLNNFAVFGGLRGWGMYSLGSSISLDSTQGLRDGTSSSWVYADYEIGSTVISHQVNVQYHAALADGEGTTPGWIARAFIDGVMLGQKEYPGEAALDVRLLQTDTELQFLSRPSVAMSYKGGGEGGGAFDILYQSAQAAPSDFTVGLGAFGLDKGGEIYTDMLWFLGPQLGPEPDSDEFFVFDQFSIIGSCLKDAKSQLSGSSVSLINVSEALSQVSAAMSSAISTMFVLKDGLKNNVFDEKAAAKTAAKIGKQTYKKLNKIQNQLQAMLDKSKVNTSQVKGICKSLQKMTDSSLVGRANMLGVRVKSIKQLDIGYAIDPADVPPLF